MSQTISVDQGVQSYMEHHKAHSRPNSVRAYKYTLDRFLYWFSGADITAVSADDIAAFLELITEGLAKSTKNNRAGHISSFFNFVVEAFSLNHVNPCHRAIIKRNFKKPRMAPPDLLDKETVDEIIYRASGRDRLMLELMGRTAMRVGEVRKIRPRNLNTEVNTISLERPKSRRQGEVVYIPQRMMRRIEDYVREMGIARDDRIFSISYSTAWRMVTGRGIEAGVKFSPHDLRRHAATQASRSGMPLELVSKVMLRHADIATTQRYLGKVSVAEASRAIEDLLG